MAVRYVDSQRIQAKTQLFTHQNVIKNTGIALGSHQGVRNATYFMCSLLYFGSKLVDDKVLRSFGIYDINFFQSLLVSNMFTNSHKSPDGSLRISMFLYIAAQIPNICLHKILTTSKI